jgi:hypothetical protein
LTGVVVKTSLPLDLIALKIEKTIETATIMKKNTKNTSNIGSGNMGSVGFTHYSTRLLHAYLNADVTPEKIFYDIKFPAEKRK